MDMPDRKLTILLTAQQLKTLLPFVSDRAAIFSVEPILQPDVKTDQISPTQKVPPPKGTTLLARDVICAFMKPGKWYTGPTLKEHIMARGFSNFSFYDPLKKLINQGIIITKPGTGKFPMMYQIATTPENSQEEQTDS